MKRTVKTDRSFTEGSVVTAVRLPKPLSKRAKDKCRNEDLTFSQLMRRALRRELGDSETL